MEESGDAGLTAGSLEVEGTVGTEEAREELGHSSVEELIRRARKKYCSPDCRPSALPRRYRWDGERGVDGGVYGREVSK